MRDLGKTAFPQVHHQNVQIRRFKALLAIHPDRHVIEKSRRERLVLVVLGISPDTKTGSYPEPSPAHAGSSEAEPDNSMFRELIPVWGSRNALQGFRQAVLARDRAEEVELVADLRAAGIDVETVWDLVNRPNDD